MIRLPNGKSIDLDMLETAMEDSDLANRYFLNLVSGEVVFFSDHLGLSDEDERLLEEIDGSNDYVNANACKRGGWRCLPRYVSNRPSPNLASSFQRTRLSSIGVPFVNVTVIVSSGVPHAHPGDTSG